MLWLHPLRILSTFLDVQKHHNKCLVSDHFLWKLKIMKNAGSTQSTTANSIKGNRYIIVWVCGWVLIKVSILLISLIYIIQPGGLLPLFCFKSIVRQVTNKIAVIKMKFVGVQQQENNFIDELMYELKKRFLTAEIK